MLTLFLMLACTGTRPPENPADAVPPPSDPLIGAEAPPSEAEEVPAEGADIEPALPRGVTEQRGTVQTAPAAALPLTSTPTGGTRGCVPACVEKRSESGLSPERLQLECIRACGQDDFVIRDGYGIGRGSGARVAMEGQVQEIEAAGLKGYGLVLRDGTRVWATYGAAPEGWSELVGQDVRVIGTLWDGPAPAGPGSVASAGVPEPHLVDWEKPIKLWTTEPLDTGDESAQDPPPEASPESVEPAPEAAPEAAPPAPEPLPAP